MAARTSIRNRKSQVQMGENVIILFIFFVLLVFGIIYFMRVQETKSSQQIGANIQGRGIEIARQIAFLPELQCSKTAVEQYACYDKYSLQALQTLTNDGSTGEYYFPVFGYSTVSMQTLFPKKEDPVIIYNNTDEKQHPIAIIPTQLPVVVCDYAASTQGEVCTFAVMEIDTYNYGS